MIKHECPICGNKMEDSERYSAGNVLECIQCPFTIEEKHLSRVTTALNSDQAEEVAKLEAQVVDKQRFIEGLGNKLLSLNKEIRELKGEAQILKDALELLNIEGTESIPWAINGFPVKLRLVHEAMFPESEYDKNRSVADNLYNRIKMTVNLEVNVLQALTLRAMFKHWNNTSANGCTEAVGFLVNELGNFSPKAECYFSEQIPEMDYILESFTSEDTDAKIKVFMGYKLAKALQSHEKMDKTWKNWL